MLPIPTSNETSACLIGIDPGSTTLGVGILTIDVVSLEILKAEAYTFDANKLDGMEWLAESHSDRIQRMYRHEQNLKNIFHFYRPLAVSVESPFINIRRPQAYGALTEIFFLIRQAVISYDPWCPFYSVEPSNVKKAVGASGGGDKLAVKNALTNVKEICDKLITPIELLDEHSVDALCVAYFQYKKYI